MKQLKNVFISLGIICTFFSTVIATVYFSSLSLLFSHLSIDYRNNRENTLPQFVMIFLAWFCLSLQTTGTKLETGEDVLSSIVGSAIAGFVITIIEYVFIKRRKNKSEEYFEEYDNEETIKQTLEQEENVETETSFGVIKPKK